MASEIHGESFVLPFQSKSSLMCIIVLGYLPKKKCACRASKRIIVVVVVNNGANYLQYFNVHAHIIGFRSGKSR